MFRLLSTIILRELPLGGDIIVILCRCITTCLTLQRDIGNKNAHISYNRSHDAAVDWEVTRG